MIYKLIIFDFDGTIADTSEGILDAHRYTLNQFGQHDWTNDDLVKLIGGNLLNTYSNDLGFGIATAREAVHVYRKRYAEVGIKKAKLYTDFAEMLNCLKKNNCKIGIATLKSDAFVKKMISNLNISQYFDSVFGMDEDDRFSKADLITKCVNDALCKKADTLFVGDSNGDYIGAKEACVDFVGVTYGFGFKEDETYDFDTINTPIELVTKLSRHIM